METKKPTFPNKPLNVTTILL